MAALSASPDHKQDAAATGMPTPAAITRTAATPTTTCPGTVDPAPDAGGSGRVGAVRSTSMRGSERTGAPSPTVARPHAGAQADRADGQETTEPSEERAEVSRGAVSHRPATARRCELRRRRSADVRHDLGGEALHPVGRASPPQRDSLGTTWAAKRSMLSLDGKSRNQRTNSE